jgi:hypothetical protein
MDLLERYMIGIRQSHRKRGLIESLIDEIDEHLSPLLKELRESNDVNLIQRIIDKMPKGYHKQLAEHHVMKLNEVIK